MTAPDLDREFGDVGKFGPCMRGLSPERQAFVLAVVDQPTKNWAAAARRAGFRGGLYGGNKSNVFKQIGYRLAHDDKILAAIEEVCAKRFKMGGVIAMSGLIALASNPRSKNHLRACESLADRAGYGAAQRIEVDHTHTDRTPAALIEAITKSAVLLGLDVETVRAKLLGGAAPAMKTIEHGAVTEVGDG